MKNEIDNISPNRKISKSNNLIQAEFKLSVAEQRLILCAISQIDSRETPKETVIKITAEQYSILFNIDKSTAYQQMQDAQKRLSERKPVTLTDDNDKKEVAHWVSSITYYKNLGSVELTLSTKIMTYLTQLTGSFTSYELRQVTRMNREYTFRLFELLTQHRDFGRRKISIEKLRRWLQIEDGQYKLFKDFRIRVIEASVEEIKAHTNLYVRADYIREGRKVTHVEFVFYDQEQLALDM